jgi:hypothetical protein
VLDQCGRQKLTNIKSPKLLKWSLRRQQIIFSEASKVMITSTTTVAQDALPNPQDLKFQVERRTFSNQK